MPKHNCDTCAYVGRNCYDVLVCTHPDMMEDDEYYCICDEPIEDCEHYEEARWSIWRRQREGR